MQSSTELRLNKFLRNAGIASRRKCDELIQAGKVSINGKTITALGTCVDPTLDSIRLDNQLLKLIHKKVYLLLHKPMGYIVAKSDPLQRKLVTDLVPKYRAIVFPVGRLDYNTEGALLLTNDGECANKLIHPRYHIKKTYRCTIKGIPTTQNLNQLRDGVSISTGTTLPAKVVVKRKSSIKSRCIVEITISEGKNRQIRRMIEALGFAVEHLIRIQFAGLTLKNLQLGEWRHLTQQEVTMIHHNPEENYR